MEIPATTTIPDWNQKYTKAMNKGSTTYFRWLNLILTVKTVHNEGFIEGNLPIFAVDIIFTILNNFMTSCNNEETIYDTIYHQNCFTFNQTLLLQQQFCYIIDSRF